MRRDTEYYIEPQKQRTVISYHVTVFKRNRGCDTIHLYGGSFVRKGVEDVTKHRA